MEIKSYMFAWHRLIAALVIIVFAPVSALAAAPLKFCFGNDGHRAIEVVFTSHHHDLSAAEKVVKVATARPLPSSMSSTDCLDVPLINVNQRSARATDRLYQTDTQKNFKGGPPTFPPQFAAAAFCESRPSVPVAVEIVHRDPHLVSLATIVLLI
jgi:hypothetical protein